MRLSRGLGFPPIQESDGTKIVRVKCRMSALPCQSEVLVNVQQKLL